MHILIRHNCDWFINVEGGTVFCMVHISGLNKRVYQCRLSGLSTVRDDVFEPHYITLNSYICIFVCDMSEVWACRNFP